MQKASRKTWTRIIVIAVIAVAVVYLYSNNAFSRANMKPLFDRLPASLQWANPYKEELDPLYIGMVVPDLDTAFSSELRRVAQIFEQRMAAQSGIHGRPVKIIFYPNQHDTPAEAEVTAQQIVKEDRALVVIGHFYSNSSIKVGGIYAAAGIPIITSSAGSPDITKDNPWFFRTLSNNSTMAAYAAIYTAQVLNHQQASVIYEDNTFGASLNNAFKDTFMKNGGTIVYEDKMSHRDTLDDVGAQEAKTIVEKMTQPGSQAPGIVFLALNDKEALQFMLAMRAAKQNYPLIAAYDQGDSNFAALFEKYPQEVSQPGYFTDGMYAFSPLIYDVSDQMAHDFFDTYTHIYHEQPTWLGATTYDALLVAVHAMQTTGATGQPQLLSSERQKIRDVMDSLNNPARSINGLTAGQIYFDNEHNFARPPIFGVFQKRNFASAPIQLNPIQDRRLIANLADAIAHGDIIYNGNQDIYKTKVVYTGIKINSITNVDVDKDHSFIIDFYLWFRYQGNLDVEAIEFMNAVDPVKLDTPVSELADGNINYRLYRVRAKFRTTFDLENYPFDQQHLVIQFRHKNLTSDRLIYVEDIIGMDKAQGLIARFKQDAVFATNADWDLSNARVFIDVYSNKASLGNPILINSNPNIENSQFNVKVDIQRNAPRFMLKTMLPLFCLIALAYLSLFLPGYKFETIISIMTGTMLSIVFFHVNLSNRLNVGYNVALDYVFYCTYGLFVVELTIAILAWHNQANEKVARGFMQLARFLYPAIFIAAGGILIWLYATPGGLMALERIKQLIPG